MRAGVAVLCAVLAWVPGSLAFTAAPFSARVRTAAPSIAKCSASASLGWSTAAAIKRQAIKLAPRQSWRARFVSSALRLSAKSDHELLKDVTVKSVSDDEASPLVVDSGRQLVLLLTHFGDLSSWEYAQQIRQALPALEAGGVRVMAVGIGGREAGKKFAELVGFPEKYLYYDQDARACEALGCVPGFGRASVSEAQANMASPYLRLLPMLLGVGSPGTLAKVIYGYLGDRSCHIPHVWLQRARATIPAPGTAKTRVVVRPEAQSALYPIC